LYDLLIFMASVRVRCGHGAADDRPYENRSGAVEGVARLTCAGEPRSPAAAKKRAKARVEAVRCMAC